MTRLVAAASALAFAALAAMPAAAQTYGVRFQNVSGMTVYSIRTSPTHDAYWSDDYLYENVLVPGAGLNITFTNVSNCYYDVEIVFTDGTGYTDTWDICSYSQYNIGY